MSSFLGHIVNQHGLSADPQKIKAAMEWQRPVNVTEIQGFLGLAGYYRHFVEGFSRIAASMTRLTQKGMRFEWSDKSERSFQKLKDKLVSIPVLMLQSAEKSLQYTVMHLSRVWLVS